MRLVFDEYIWKVATLQGKAISKTNEAPIHKEWDVNFSISDPQSDDEIKYMIKGLIGQDAHCHYSDKLTVHLLRCGDPRHLWALAFGGHDTEEYFSLLLVFHENQLQK